MPKAKPVVTKASRLTDGTLDDLNRTLAALCAELRERVKRGGPHEGGLSNMELIGAVKALQSIQVQALSLLEDEQDPKSDD